MHPLDLGSGVVTREPTAVHFVETSPPLLSPEVAAAVDRAWDEVVRANPAAFDGAVTLCTDVRSGSHGLDIEWSRATYRLRTTRGMTGAPKLSSLFVCVAQPTFDGRLLIGRMSGSTSSPDLLQFPGGNVEPPPPGEPLTAAHLQRHAATELAEETGIDVDPGALTLWAVVRTSNGNLGFFFLAPPIPADTARERHAVARADRSHGREPEFAEVTAVADAAELAALTGRPADYVLPLLSRYRAGRHVRSH